MSPDCVEIQQLWHSSRLPAHNLVNTQLNFKYFVNLSLLPVYYEPATTCYFCQPGVVSRCWSQLMYKELLLILNRQTDERDQNHTYMHCNVYNLVPVMVSYINAVFMRVLAKLLWIGAISSLYIWQFWYAFFSLIISGNSTLCFIMSDTKMVIKITNITQTVYQ